MKHICNLLNIITVELLIIKAEIEKLSCEYKYFIQYFWIDQNKSLLIGYDVHIIIFYNCYEIKLDTCVLHHAFFNSLSIA